MTNKINTPIIPVAPLVAKFPAVTFDVRYFVEDSTTWWVAADVCKVLDLSNVTVAIKSLAEDERAKFNLGRSPIHGGGGETNCVNESGLYRLIFQSRKPEAEKFRRWVFHEVLPSLRKTGKYEMPGVKVEDEKPVQEVQTEADVVFSEADLDKEKFIIEAWNWLEVTIDTHNLSSTEQLVLLQWITLIYKNISPLEISAHKLAKFIGKDTRTIKGAILKLTQKKLFPPPFTLQDLMFMEFHK